MEHPVDIHYRDASFPLSMVQRGAGFFKKKTLDATRQLKGNSFAK